MSSIPPIKTSKKIAPTTAPTIAIGDVRVDGFPQFGQFFAFVEHCVPQSLQLINAIPVFCFFSVASQSTFLDGGLNSCAESFRFLAGGFAFSFFRCRLRLHKRA
jgi:hypothetical protein